MRDNIMAGANIHAGDGGYSIGTREKYEAFVKVRNESLKKMKYFDALTQVENQVIRLSEMRNMLAVLTNGIDGSSEEEVTSAFHYVEGTIADISEQLSESFQHLFDVIAEKQ